MCKYCEDLTSKKLDAVEVFIAHRWYDKASLFKQEGKTYLRFYGENTIQKEINYCPFCGRKLKEE